MRTMVSFITGIVLCTTQLSSCTKEIPEDFVGSWESGMILMEIPVELENGQEILISDSAYSIIEIFSNMTATGHFGSAFYTDVPIRKNPGDAESKGIAYKVKCGELGRIFPGDPLEEKRIEFWIYPLHGNYLEGELLYFRGLQEFMIAQMKYERTDQ